MPRRPALRHLISLFASLALCLPALAQRLPVSGMALLVQQHCGANLPAPGACPSSVTLPAADLMLDIQDEHNRLAAQVRTAEDGSFTVALAPGQYRIALHERSLHLVFDSMPFTVRRHGKNQLTVAVTALMP